MRFIIIYCATTSRMLLKIAPTVLRAIPVEIFCFMEKNLFICIWAIFFDIRRFYKLGPVFHRPRRSLKCSFFRIQKDEAHSCKFSTFSVVNLPYSDEIPLSWWSKTPSSNNSNTRRNSVRYLFPIFFGRLCKKRNGFIFVPSRNCNPFTQ